ncbi:hypothetical protein [Winogradskyella sp. 3972H.M.0a.05]|uniref:hypothetical protein n=1 Tax=Winogradskyella sp. 3972H.M.0a.05 TaxID=2950277 RepID=UPI0033930AD1
MSIELEGLEPIVENNVLVGYTIQKDQGPSQISLDINNPETQKKYGYTLQKPVTWKKVVLDNATYYARAGGLENWRGTNMLDIDNPIYRNLNSNKGDEIVIKIANITPSPKPKANVIGPSHSGLFKVTITEGVNVFGQSLGEITISSNMDAPTGFWETRVSTGLSYTTGFGIDAGFATSVKGSININTSLKATSLVDWANKSGLISTTDFSLIGVYSKVTAQKTDGSGDGVWTANAFGAGFTAGINGSKGENTFEPANFYYGSGNKVIMGLTRFDSIIRAAHNTSLPGKSEFLLKNNISNDSLNKVKDWYKNLPTLEKAKQQ